MILLIQYNYKGFIMKKQQLKADLALLLATAFWGTTYVLTKFILDYLEPLNIISLRFLIAAVILVIVFHRRLTCITKSFLAKTLFLSVFLLLSFMSMNYALLYTSASNAAFIGGTTVLFVPIFEWIFLGRRLGKKIWFCVGLSLVGVALLTLNADFRLSFGFGEVLSLSCALTYAIYILMVDRIAKEYDPVAVSSVQMIFISLISTALTFFFETYRLPPNPSSWFVLLLLAFPCTAIAYVIQFLAQKYTTPTHTGLIISMETVFGGFFAFVLLREVLSLYNYLGAFLMFVSIFIMEMPAEFFKKSRTKEEPL